MKLAPLSTLKGVKPTMAMTPVERPVELLSAKGSPDEQPERSAKRPKREQEADAPSSAAKKRRPGPEDDEDEMPAKAKRVRLSATQPEPEDDDEMHAGAPSSAAKHASAHSSAAKQRPEAECGGLLLPPSPPDVCRDSFIKANLAFDKRGIAGVDAQMSAFRASGFGGTTDASVTMTFRFDVHLVSSGERICPSSLRMAEHLELEQVRLYNERTLGRTPVLRPPSTLRLEGPEGGERYSISIALSRNSVVITGVRTFAQFLGLAEYCRGLFEAIRGERVELGGFKCDKVFSTFAVMGNMNGKKGARRIKVDANALVARLVHPACNVRIVNDDAVTYRLSDPSVAPEDYPTVTVLAQGETMIEADDFATLAEAHQHVLGELVGLL
jgi:hypothetical protein